MEATADDGVYRVPLTGDEALAATRAVDEVGTKALDARLELLGGGFADTHPLCQTLDATAREYAALGEAIRRQGTATPT